MVRKLAALTFGLGIAAAIAIATWAAEHASGTEHSPVSPPGGWRDAWIVSLISAFVLYVAAIALAPRPGRIVLALGATAIAIQLIPLAGPLLLSTDVYAYWDYGRLAAVHGVNPYETRPSAYPDDRAYELMGSDWQEKRTVYGPVWTVVSEGHAHVVGTSSGRAQLLYRILAAVSLSAIVVLIAWRTWSPAATIFVGFNPLLALHFGGGGHNDALMALALVCAVLFACAGRLEAEGAAWALAASIKVIPLVLLPLRLLEARARRIAFGYRGLLAAAAAVAVVAFARYGWQWLTIFTPVANQLRSSSSLGLPYWAGKAGIPEGAARLGLLIAFVAAYVWLLVHAARGRAHLALATGLLLLATSWLQPWYAVWAVPLAALEDDPWARVLAVVLTGYFLRDALPL